MSIVLNFDESVKGTTKVSINLSRLLSINANACAQLATEKDLDRELNLKNADLVLEVERKQSDKECLL